jgi:ubiquinone/menaquinone biosynthesis C-methylase UbiE
MGVSLGHIDELSEKGNDHSKTFETEIQGVSRIDFYNKIWIEEWQDMERLNPTARHLERMIVKLLRRVGPISNILDVGCGMGVNMKRIHKYSPEINLVGADLSEDILNIARLYVGDDLKIEYVPLDIGKSKLNRKFDLVLCSQVLEHIENDVAAIKHMVEMCNQYLLITVPGGAYNSTSQLVGHYRHYTKDDLVSKVVSNGFKICYLREWGFPFHSLYKFALHLLPLESQKKIGYGKYGLMKKGISSLLYFLFFGNVLHMGANIIMLTERNH